MKNVITSAIVLCLSGAAFADQCAYVSQEQAESFARMISIGDTVYHLCEPCGDSTETQSEEAIKVESIAIESVGGDQAEVLINGRGMDLAYLYLVTAELGSNNIVLTNGASVVACPASGVTPHYVTLKHD